MQEQDVVNYVQGELSRRGIFYFNILGSYMTTDTGEPDIVACVNGQLVAIECKLNSRVSTAQFRRGLELLRSGGRFIVANMDISIEDMLANTLHKSPVNPLSEAEAMISPKSTLEFVSDDSIAPLTVDDTELSYGQRIARDKYKDKRSNARDISPKPLQERVEMTSRPLFYPETVSESTYINWEDSFTETSSKYASQLILNSRFAFLTARTGTGKTASVIATAGKMAIKYKSDINVAIVTTSKSVESNGWIKTINEWNNEHDYRLNILWHTSHKGFTLAMKEKKNIDFIKKELGKKGLLIVDEAHEFKNPTAKGSRSLAKLKTVNKMLLTATDVTNDKIKDIASYLIIAGYYNSFNDFMNKEGLKDLRNKSDKFLIYDENGDIDPIKWTNWTDVEAKWRSIHVKYTNPTNVLFPTVASEDVFLDSAESLEEDVNSILKALKQRSFDTPKQAYQAILDRIYTDDERLAKIIALITQPNVKQPLLFYMHNSVKHAMQEQLSCNRIEWQEISGEVKSTEFDSSKDCPVLVQYKSGGSSIEFTGSNTSVFVENQPSVAKYSQAQGRNVRRGMTGTVTQYTVHSMNEFDSKMIKQRNLLQRSADKDFEKNFLNDLI